MLLLHFDLYRKYKRLFSAIIITGWIVSSRKNLNWWFEINKIFQFWWLSTRDIILIYYWMLLEDILITAFLFVHLLGRLATYHLIQMKIDVTSGSHQEVRGIIETGTSDFNYIAVIIKEFEKARKSSNNTIFFYVACR